MIKAKVVLPDIYAAHITPDLAENDPESLAYIKSRAFYVSDDKSILFSGTSVVSSDYTDAGEVAFTISQGNLYTLVIGTTSVSAVAQYDSTLQTSVVTIDGKSFYVSDGHLYYKNFVAESVFDFVLEQSIHRLDQKFLPEIFSPAGYQKDGDILSVKDGELAWASSEYMKYVGEVKFEDLPSTAKPGTTYRLLQEYDADGVYYPQYQVFVFDGTAWNVLGYLPDKDTAHGNFLKKAQNLSDVEDRQTALNNVTDVASVTKNGAVLTADKDSQFKALSGSFVYVDPVNGSDDNNGCTFEFPVKTLPLAMSLANAKGVYIYLIGSGEVGMYSVSAAPFVFDDSAELKMYVPACVTLAMYGIESTHPITIISDGDIRVPSISMYSNAQLTLEASGTIDLSLVYSHSLVPTTTEFVPGTLVKVRCKTLNLWSAYATSYSRSTTEDDKFSCLCYSFDFDVETFTFGQPSSGTSSAIYAIVAKIKAGVIKLNPNTTYKFFSTFFAYEFDIDCKLFDFTGVDSSVVNTVFQSGTFMLSTPYIYGKGITADDIPVSHFKIQYLNVTGLGTTSGYSLFYPTIYMSVNNSYLAGKFEIEVGVLDVTDCTFLALANFALFCGSGGPGVSITGCINKVLWSQDLMTVQAYAIPNVLFRYTDMGSADQYANLDIKILDYAKPVDLYFDFSTSSNGGNGLSPETAFRSTHAFAIQVAAKYLQTGICLHLLHTGTTLYNSNYALALDEFFSSNVFPANVPVSFVADFPLQNIRFVGIRADMSDVVFSGFDTIYITNFQCSSASSTAKFIVKNSKYVTIDGTHKYSNVEVYGALTTYIGLQGAGTSITAVTDSFTYGSFGSSFVIDSESGATLKANSIHVKATTFTCQSTSFISPIDVDIQCDSFVSTGSLSFNTISQASVCKSAVNFDIKSLNMQYMPFFGISLDGTNTDNTVTFTKFDIKIGNFGTKKYSETTPFIYASSTGKLGCTMNLDFGETIQTYDLCHSVGTYLLQYGIPFKITPEFWSTKHNESSTFSPDKVLVDSFVMAGSYSSSGGIYSFSPVGGTTLSYSQFQADTDYYIAIGSFEFGPVQFHTYTPSSGSASYCLGNPCFYVYYAFNVSINEPHIGLVWFGGSDYPSLYVEDSVLNNPYYQGDHFYEKISFSSSPLYLPISVYTKHESIQKIPTKYLPDYDFSLSEDEEGHILNRPVFVENGIGVLAFSDLYQAGTTWNSYSIYSLNYGGKLGTWWMQANRSFRLIFNGVDYGILKSYHTSSSSTGVVYIGSTDASDGSGIHFSDVPVGIYANPNSSPADVSIYISKSIGAGPYSLELYAVIDDTWSTSSLTAQQIFHKLSASGIAVDANVITPKTVYCMPGINLEASDGYDGLTKDTAVTTVRRAAELCLEYGDDCYIEFLGTTSIPLAQYYTQYNDTWAWIPLKIRVNKDQYLIIMGSICQSIDVIGDGNVIIGDSTSSSSTTALFNGACINVNITGNVSCYASFFMPSTGTIYYDYRQNSPAPVEGYPNGSESLSFKCKYLSFYGSTYNYPGVATQSTGYAYITATCTYVDGSTIANTTLGTGSRSSTRNPYTYPLNGSLTTTPVNGSYYRVVIGTSEYIMKYDSSVKRFYVNSSDSSYIAYTSNSSVSYLSWSSSMKGRSITITQTTISSTSFTAGNNCEYLVGKQITINGISTSVKTAVYDAVNHRTDITFTTTFTCGPGSYTATYKYSGGIYSWSFDCYSFSLCYSSGYSNNLTALNLSLHADLFYCSSSVPYFFYARYLDIDIGSMSVSADSYYSPFVLQEATYENLSYLQQSTTENVHIGSLAYSGDFTSYKVGSVTDASGVSYAYPLVSYSTVSITGSRLPIKLVIDRLSLESTTRNSILKRYLPYPYLPYSIVYEVFGRVYRVIGDLYSGRFYNPSIVGSDFVQWPGRADWSESKTDSESYVNNRTHYDDSKFNQTVVLSSGSNWGIAEIYSLEEGDAVSLDLLSQSNTYYTDLHFTGVVPEIQTSGTTSISIADASGKSCGVIVYDPYHITSMFTGSATLAFTGDPSVLSFVLQIAPNLKKLDNKFLNIDGTTIKSVGGVLQAEVTNADWDVDDTTSFAYVKNRTHFGGLDFIGKDITVGTDGKIVGSVDSNYYFNPVVAFQANMVVSLYIDGEFIVSSTTSGTATGGGGGASIPDGLFSYGWNSESYSGAPSGETAYIYLSISSNLDKYVGKSVQFVTEVKKLNDIYINALTDDDIDDVLSILND